MFQIVHFATYVDAKNLVISRLLAQLPRITRNFKAVIKSAASAAFAEGIWKPRGHPIPCRLLAKLSSWHSPANPKEAVPAADLITASRSIPGRLRYKPI